MWTLIRDGILTWGQRINMYKHLWHGKQPPPSLIKKLSLNVFLCHSYWCYHLFHHYHFGLDHPIYFCLCGYLSFLKPPISWSFWTFHFKSSSHFTCTFCTPSPTTWHPSRRRIWRKERMLAWKLRCRKGIVLWNGLLVIFFFLLLIFFFILSHKSI